MPEQRSSTARRLWKRIKAWWAEPIVVKVETRKSPDWEGDAARYRQERGW